MPCNGGWEQEGCSPRIVTEYVYKEDPAQKEKYEIRINSLKALLCSACAILEEEYQFNFAKNPALDMWFHKHKEEDQIRIQAEIEKEKKIEKERMILESIKAKTISELTKEEKKFLGMNL